MWVSDVSNALEVSPSGVKTAREARFVGSSTYAEEYDFGDKPYISVNYPVNPGQALPILEGGWRVATVTTPSGERIAFDVDANGMSHFPTDEHNSATSHWVTYTLIYEPENKEFDTLRAASGAYVVGGHSFVQYDYRLAPSISDRKYDSTLDSIQNKKYDYKPFAGERLATGLSTLELYYNLAKNPQANCNTATAEFILDDLLENNGRSSLNFAIGAINPDPDSGERMAPHMTAIDREGHLIDPTPTANNESQKGSIGDLVPYASIALCAIGVANSRRLYNSTRRAGEKLTQAYKSERLNSYSADPDVRMLAQAYNQLTYSQYPKLDLDTVNGNYDPTSFIQTHRNHDTEHIANTLRRADVTPNKAALRKMSALLQNAQITAPVK
jgi:hypothetical protein